MYPRIIFFVFLLSILNIFCSEKSHENSLRNIFVAKGKASWYGPGFNGKRTASGDTFNMNDYTAAHRKMEFGTLVKVTNIRNQKSVVVKINDRGPLSKGKIIDLSKKAAEKIDMIKAGIANVRIEIVGYDRIDVQAVIKHYRNILGIKQNNNK